MTQSIENEIRKRLDTIVKVQFPSVFTTSEYDSGIARFPCITMVEADNSTLSRTVTVDGDSHSVLLYEINVYSNLASGAREECKKIMQIVCDFFESMRFTRTARGFIPNAADTNIKRMVARFTAIQGKYNTLYQT